MPSGTVAAFQIADREFSRGRDTVARALADFSTRIGEIRESERKFEGYKVPIFNELRGRESDFRTNPPRTAPFSGTIPAGFPGAIPAWFPDFSGWWNSLRSES